MKLYIQRIYIKMITSLKINDNTKTPYYYTKKVFENGKEFKFDKGVNIIIGPNGSGKSTLLKLLRAYTLTTDRFSSGLSACDRLIGYKREFIGVDVYANYMAKTFNLECTSEMTESQFMRDVTSFTKAFDKHNLSTGEAQIAALSKFFDNAFNEPFLEFPKTEKYYPQLYEYYNTHHVAVPIITFIMDEPDRNLDIDNVKELYSIFSTEKKDVQIITSIHNPLLIYKLVGKVNFIDITGNYLNKVIEFIES